MKDEAEETKQPVKQADPVSSIEDEWRKLKIQNQILNTELRKTDVDTTLKFQDLPLPFEPDGSLQFFWIDAHEEQNGAEIFLFGKIWQPEENKFISCSIRVHGMNRTCYALPKVKGKARGSLTKEEENKLLMNVFTELEEIRKRRFPNITEWKCKGVTRKYCFETPLEHGEHKFMKIKYPATMPQLPPNMSGNTFETVFGTNQSMLELFIMKRNIKGPCWLTLTNVKKVPSDGNRSTWCR
jgi:DNA polymerase alpha subunit A